MKKTAEELRNIWHVKDAVDNLAELINSSEAQNNIKGLVQEFVIAADWSGIPPLEARRMLDAQFKSRGIDPRYIRMLLPKKYKYTNQARTKKSPIKPHNSINKRQKIDSLQVKIRGLRNENKLLSQTFGARGFIVVDRNRMPVKVLVNPATRTIERGELD